MYSFNYAEEIIAKEKNKSIFVRLFKILTLFVHIGIIVIILLAALKSKELDNYNGKITDVKNNIEEKRTRHQISEAEKEWETRYCKMSAIEEQLKNRTYYSSVLKDFGTFLPEQDSVINLSIKDNIANVDLYVNEEILKKYPDYVPVLNSSFEKSEYINNNFVMEKTEIYKINNKDVNAMKLRVDLNKKK